MRVVAGKWAGKPLISPAGRVRPTTETLRDQWITILEPDLEGARVLDLFSGSGALGIEALSRGARYVDFVENHPSALHALKANIAVTRSKERVRIYKHDAIPFVEKLEAGRYDIALADPPYGSRKADRIIEYWMQVRFARILCVEHAPDHKLPGRGQTRNFGDNAITFFRARSSP